MLRVRGLGSRARFEDHLRPEEGLKSSGESSWRITSKIKPETGLHAGFCGGLRTLALNLNLNLSPSTLNIPGAAGAPH